MFKKQKNILQNFVVTAGYSTEESRKGILVTFLFDINKQPLLPSLPMGL